MTNSRAIRVAPGPGQNLSHGLCGRVTDLLANYKIVATSRTYVLLVLASSKLVSTVVLPPSKKNVIIGCVLAKVVYV
jgi:hypothetical protein